MIIIHIGFRCYLQRKYFSLRKERTDQKPLQTVTA